MSNEIQKTQNQEVSIWSADNFALLQRMGQMFSSSSLVPKEYQGNLPNCVIACNMAQRMKADPFMVMQNLDIIHGRPSLRSKFLIASVNSSGKFEPLKYRFEKGESLKGLKYTIFQKDYSSGKNTAVVKTFSHDIINIKCVAYTTKKGTSGILESSEVSLEMAIKEGWYHKSGSKWQTMPEQMLRYRTAAFWTSAYAPEISMGMSTSDELVDVFEKEEIEDQSNSAKVSTIVEEEGNKVDFETGEIIEEAKENHDNDINGQQKMDFDDTDDMKI